MICRMDEHATKTDFTNNEKNLTIGGELEFQVLDKNSLSLTPRAGDILASTSLAGLTKELFQSTLDLITPVANNVLEIEHYYTNVLPVLPAEAKTLDLTFAGTGTHPSADYL